MNTNSFPRPFIKWAGGKTQLLDDLYDRVPFEFNGYHEPFLGGGAFFFKLCREKRIEIARISDINRELIFTYLAIRDNPVELINRLQNFPHDENFYYNLRSVDTSDLDEIATAARMIYLNKTGFNGLYRVNSKGKFNVPFGRYKNPKYVDVDNIMAISKALKNITIHNASFESVLDYSNEGDLVYFDPPYVPLTNTANFTAYSANGFTLNDQIRLRDVCIELTRKNVFILLSNSDTEIVRRFFSSNDFILYEVLASRAINCNGTKRGKTKELIITNYSIDISIQLQLLEKKMKYRLETQK